MKSLRQRLHDENRAVYLPAISQDYARTVTRRRGGSIGSIAVADLDFLDPNSSLFHYPYALYSAGQAAPKRGEVPFVDMVSARDRQNTIMLGDSGGFQIQTGAIAFTADTPRRMMRWMEQVSDWSMVLDFPTGGIASGNVDPHIERLIAEGHDLDALSAANGLNRAYNACLLQTQLNNDYFVANRTPGATKFLNVLQGRSEAESRHWYEAVKHYPFEGWAFAGGHQKSYSLLIQRLLDMKRDGLLERCGWLHVLGVATSQASVLLTAVQRAVREAGAPEFQISFDASSPFQTAKNYHFTTGATLDRISWGSQHDPLSDVPTSRDGELLYDVIVDAVSKQDSKDGRVRTVADTAISKRVTIGEMREPGTTKTSKPGSNLLMNHNIEALINTHDRAHELMFGDGNRRDPFSIPQSVQIIEAMIGLLFKGHDLMGDPVPANALREWRHWLDALK